MKPDSIYRLSSVSKPFTVVAAMVLAEKGIICLDDTVTRWLADFKPCLANGSCPEITIEQLLTHTAGLSYGFLEPAGGGEYQRLAISDGLDLTSLTLAENVQRISQARLLYMPGTSLQYSLATDVLGAVLEQATGQNLEQVIRQYVTQPLAIDDASFTINDPCRLVVPYVDDKPQPRLMQDEMLSLDSGLYGVHFSPQRIFDRQQFYSAGTGMVGTAMDVLKLLHCLLNEGEPLFSRYSMAKLLIDRAGERTLNPGWGYAGCWQLLRDPVLAGTPQSVGTISWGGVYGHNWFIDFARRLVVVALTNTAYEGMNGQFVRDLRDAVYQTI